MAGSTRWLVGCSRCTSVTFDQRPATRCCGTGKRSGKTAPIVVIGAACLGLVAWWFWQPPPRLSGRHYDMTLALYRICNQKDAAALQRFEAEVLTASESDPDSNALPAALHEILDDARAGDWERAMGACREAMENQVHR